jgi:type IV pilus assembly protein PilC
MKVFRYRIVDQGGTRRKGKIEALDARRAAAILRERGYLVIHLAPESKQWQIPGLEFLKKVSDAERANFTRLLATMISTGLPITLALQNLVDQTENQKFGSAVADILRDVQSGSSLSTAMAKHEEIFSPTYVSLVRTGEESGNLDKTLTRLAENLEREREFKSKLKGAMIYPVIVLTAMVGVAILMMVMVVPKIAAVYEEANAALPLPTQILIAMSKVVTRGWLPGLIILVGVVMILRALKQTAQGEEFFNELAFKLPVLGRLNRQVILTRLTRTLGILIGSGVAIIDAIKLTAQALGKNSYQDRLLEVSTAVEQGFPLSESLLRDEAFPPIVSQMIAVGEDTGTMDEVLERLASFFETETEYALKNLTAALEPLIIVIMGIGVTGLAAAIILPLFNLVNVIR